MNKIIKAMNQRRAIVGTFAASAAAVGTSANAALDTAAVTAALTEAGTAAGVVGAAVLVVYVGIKAFKFIKAAL